MTKRRSLLSLLIAAAIVWLSACGATSPSTDQPTNGGPTSFEPNVIAGVLTDQSGTPLADQQVNVGLIPTSASVSARAATDAQRASVTLTDAAGKFRVPVDAEGTYAIGSVSDTTGAFATITVQRGSDGALRQTGAVTLSSAPLGAITGTVDGPGAGVFVFALGTSFSAVTDASGAFAISRVPAGTYQVVAGTAGSVTSPRSVTVNAGEVATLDAPIVFGPRVSGVDPEGFVTPHYDSVTGNWDPSTFTITGAGFGANQGLSVLRYAGTNVDAAITSWSDTSIQVDFRRLDQAYYDAGLARLGFDTSADAFRFEVVTPTGTSSSAPGGIVATWLSAGPYGDDGHLAENEARVWIDTETVWGYRLPGVTYSIEVTNGTALSSSDGRAITVVTTAPIDLGDWSPVAATFDVRLASALPTLVTVDPSADPLFAAVAATTIAVGGALEFLLEGALYTDGTLTITGSLFGWNGAPMPDDGEFALEIDPWSPDRVTIGFEIESDGSFTASGASPSSWANGDWVDVRLLYQGFELRWDSVEVLE